MTATTASFERLLALLTDGGEINGIDSTDRYVLIEVAKGDLVEVFALEPSDALHLAQDL